MNPYTQYTANQVMTATPGRLLILTYDGAIRYCRAAQESIKKRDLYEQSENIRKAQNILIELITSLNHEVDPRLSANLDAIYRYSFDKLTYATIHDDVEAVREVVQILTQLRATWVEADRKAKSDGAAQNTKGLRAA